MTLTVTDNEGVSGTRLDRSTVAPTPNTPPVAAYTFDCDELDCEFDSSGSNDPDGSIESRAWDFGDGETSTAANPSHTLTSADTYPVKLTVTDNRGEETSITKNVTVAAAVRTLIR